MRRFSAVLFLLPVFAACTTVPHNGGPASQLDRPTTIAPTVMEDFSERSSARQESSQPSTTLPIGIGFTLEPSTVLLGGALDFPMDEEFTFGPAVQYGYDSDRTIFTLFGQGKYWLPGTVEGADGRPKLRPFIQAGIGLGYIDKDGRSSDSGLILNGGAGFRYLTGQKYRLGTEALIHWAPDKIADERFWFSWELVQVVFDF